MQNIKLAAAEVFGWTRRNCSPSEPHQELIIWIGVLRPVMARNLVWLQTWPDEDYLHP